MADIESQKLIERIEESYATFREIIDSAERKRAGAGSMEGWGSKDILAHVTAWERILLHFHIGGEAFEEVIEMPDAQYQVTPFDEINEHIYRTYKDWTEAEVQTFAAEIHARLLARLSTISSDELGEELETISALGLNAYPLYEYIAANTYEHYTEHIQSFE